MFRPRGFLLNSLSIKPVDDDLVAVTVHLPVDLVSQYSRFLEALSDFFRVVDRQTFNQLAVDRVSDPAELERVEQFRRDYRNRLTASFDAYVASGLDRKEAVKRVAADLRAGGHPWAAFHLVRAELVAAGRGGRPGRPRKTEARS